MDHALPALRRSSRWLGLAAAGVLATVLVVGSLHHHTDLRDHDACVLCQVANAPAVAAVRAPVLAAPAVKPLPLLASPSQPIARLVVRRHAARAPPTA
ncbi:MAG: hypothetical protein ACRENS_06665 [Candidatus Eiseniibacteriota bacterium]